MHKRTRGGRWGGEGGSWPGSKGKMGGGNPSEKNLSMRPTYICKFKLESEYTWRKLSKCPTLTLSHNSSESRKPKNCMLMIENQMIKTNVMTMTTASRVPPPRTLKKNFFMVTLRRRRRGRRRACERKGEI